VQHPLNWLADTKLAKGERSSGTKGGGGLRGGSDEGLGQGVFITYSYKLDGDTLSLTQQRNQNGPFANPFSLKLQRVE
jgi:hypothetical protein